MSLAQPSPAVICRLLCLSPTTSVAPCWLSCPWLVFPSLVLRTAIQLSPLTVQLCAPLLRNPRWFPPHPGESWEPSQAVPRLSTARLSPWPSLALFSPRSSPQGPVHHYKVPHTSASIPVSLLPCLQFSLFLVLMPSHFRLRDPLDCSPPGSSVHGISQARVLNQVAISSSRGSSPPRDQTHVSCVSCIGR